MRHAPGPVIVSVVTRVVAVTIYGAVTVIVRDTAGVVTVVVIVIVVVMPVASQNDSHPDPAAVVVIHVAWAQPPERAIHMAIMVARRRVISVRIGIVPFVALVHGIGDGLIVEVFAIGCENIVHEMGERIIRIPVFFALIFEIEKVVIPHRPVRKTAVTERLSACYRKHVAMPRLIVNPIVVATILDHFVLRTASYVVVLDRSLGKQDPDITLGRDANNGDVCVTIGFEEYPHPIALLVGTVVIQPNLNGRSVRGLTTLGRSHRRRKHGQCRNEDFRNHFTPLFSYSAPRIDPETVPEGPLRHFLPPVGIIQSR